MGRLSSGPFPHITLQCSQLCVQFRGKKAQARTGTIKHRHEQADISTDMTSTCCHDEHLQKKKFAIAARSWMHSLFLLKTSCKGCTYFAIIELNDAPIEKFLRH